VPIEAFLLDIVRCPDAHHAPLAYDESGQVFTCTECQRVFEITDGIPVLYPLDAAGPAEVS